MRNTWCTSVHYSMYGTRYFLNHTVLGDLNVDANWRAFKSKYSNNQDLPNFFSDCGFVQNVRNPIRANSFLDATLSSSPLVKDISIFLRLAFLTTMGSVSFLKLNT